MHSFCAHTFRRSRRLAARVAGVAAALALLGTAASDALAQAGGGYGTRARQAAARALTAERPVQGRLSAADPRFADGSHFQVWRFAARAGDDLVLSLASREFTAFLMVIAERGDSEQPLQMAMADTAARSAALTFHVPADGEYLIVANTLEAAATGRYELSLQYVPAEAVRALRNMAGGPQPLSGVRAIREILIGEVPLIALGQAVDAELTATDDMLADSSRFRAWRYDGRAGERLVIDLSSDAFDTYLLLARQTPTGPALYRENDDRDGSSTHSQLAVELPETGPYFIIATSFQPQTTGAFQLTLRSMAAACAAAGPCEPTAAARRETFFANVLRADAPLVTRGDSVLARLGGADATLGDGTRFKAYRIRGEANDEIAIFLDARAPDATRFDPFLHLLRRDGDSLVVVAGDDDNGGQRNALVTTRLPSAGEYIVVANGLTAADTGNFSLLVQSLSDACAARSVCRIGADQRSANPGASVRRAATGVIAMGTSVTGQFDPGSARFADGKPFAPWRYTAQAGERVVVTNRSRDFDALVTVFAVEGDSVREIGRDDDGAGGLDAQLALEFPTAGEYLIVSGSFDVGAQGSYTLSLEQMDIACARGGPCAPGEVSAATQRLMPALAATSRPLPARGPVAGALIATSPHLEGGGRFQAFRFRGRANERVVLTMESESADAYLHLAFIRSAGLRLVGSDDDGGLATNARLVATLPETGEYLVIASVLEGLSDTATVQFQIARAACDDACAALQDVPGSRSLADYQPARRAESPRVPANGVVEAMLGDGAARLGDGTPFHAYRIEARQGQTLRAAVHSTDFDPVVILLRLERTRVLPVAGNDDGGEGTDAFIEWPIDRSGTYLVLVTAFEDDSSLGAYILNAAQGPADDGDEFRRTAAAAAVRPLLQLIAAVTPQPIAHGASAEGEFVADGPTLPGRGRLATFRLTGSAGQRVDVTLTAEDTDAYLFLVQRDGSVLRLLSEDDDGAGGTDARITMTLPADGEYLIVASEYDASNRSSTRRFRLALSLAGGPR